MHLWKLIKHAIRSSSSGEVEALVCTFDCSFNVVSPGHIVGDIYTEELEDLEHLQFEGTDQAMVS